MIKGTVKGTLNLLLANVRPPKDRPGSIKIAERKDASSKSLGPGDGVNQCRASVIGNDHVLTVGDKKCKLTW